MIGHPARTTGLCQSSASPACLRLRFPFLSFSVVSKRGRFRASFAIGPFFLPRFLFSFSGSNKEEKHFFSKLGTVSLARRRQSTLQSAGETGKSLGAQVWGAWARRKVS